MDITTLFRACVKTIRTRNKAFGVSGDADKTRILSTRHQKSDFVRKAKDVVGQITRLRDFLLEHRKAYLNFASHLPDMPQMSDIERDKIDSGAQRIMNTCSHLIHDFKRESHHLDGPPQLLEHQQAVLELVENYLKAVCKIYSEQRAIRVKRAIEIKKMSRLESMSGKHSTGEFVSQNTSQNNSLNESNGGESPRKIVHRNSETESSFLTDDDQLTAEELQMFELENASLFNELNNTIEEVKQIESKMVHIAELQEIFTEKVLQQDIDIDRIVTTVVGSTENIKDANEQIREAIQRNAGLRVWVLFFLLVMSFSLLFLDWYND